MKNKNLRIYNVIAITLLVIYVAISAYLVMASLFEEIRLDGGMYLTYYSPQTFLLVLIILIPVLLLPDLAVYFKRDKENMNR